ncbi:opioid binding protein/cell adhesion molecule-like, partial [Paragonimus westermani]
ECLNFQDLDNVTWIRSPRQILTRGIFRVTENDRITMAPQVLLRRQDFSLFIRPVLFEDRGEYRCAVVFQNAVHFRSVTLRILVPPKITRSPVPFLKVDEGSSLQIDCAADGFPSPDIDWFVSRSNHTFDGGRFTMRTALEEFSSLDERITGSKGTLKIYRLHRAMSGQLICVASNGVEPNDQTTVALSVRFPPDITMANRVIRQSLGMNTVLSCTVVANPPGIIQWYYNHHVKIIASSCEILSEEERKYCLRKYSETSSDRS